MSRLRNFLGCFLIFCTLGGCMAVGVASESDSAPSGATQATGFSLSGDRLRDNLKRAAAYSRKNKGVSLVAMQNGKIVFEDYSGSGASGKPRSLASGSKTFWGVVAAAAVEDGLFEFDETVSDTIKEWRNDPRKSKITVRQLLNFTSGLDPSEKLLRGRSRASNKFELVLSVPSYDDPGDTFVYGPSHLTAFGVLLKRKLGAAGRNDDPVAYLKERILDPIGFDLARWHRNKSGDPEMPGGGVAAATEWIKFGELINKHGNWHGKQVVRSDLIDQIFSGSSANPAYGLAVWLNHNSDGNRVVTVVNGKMKKRRKKGDDGQIFKDGPKDLAMAAGKGKQRMFIIPSMDLVIVRQGENGNWTDREFLALALKGSAKGADLGLVPDAYDAASGQSAQDWRQACAADVRKFCASAAGNGKALKKCFRENRRRVSTGCKSALKSRR